MFPRAAYFVLVLSPASPVYFTMDTAAFVDLDRVASKVKRGNSGHSLVLTDSLAHNFENTIASTARNF